MKGKRVFVSGGAGVIGTALVDKLLKSGADIFVGDLKLCPAKWLGKVKYRQGDLSSLTPDELITFDPEIFFHLAATFERTEESYPFFGDNFHHNVKLSHHLINCLKDSTSLQSVIFASSYLVYDSDLYLNENSVPLTEESILNPRNICGSAKLFHEGEMHFMHLFHPNVSFISARIFRVYGKGSRDIISRWVRAALKGEKLYVYCPKGRFDYIFADDVAEGLLRLAKIKECCVVNLGSGRSRSVREIIDILRFHFPNLETETVESDIPIEHSEASIKKLESLTSWKPPHDLETGIEKLIDFEKGQKSSHDETSRSNVLITSLSKKMPLIQAVRCAVSSIGLHHLVYGCDTDRNCIGQYGVDEFWHCLPLKKMTVEDFISYCQTHQINAIIPTRNGELPFFAHHRKRLNDEGIAVMVSTSKAIEICLDKLVFAQHLDKHHFPVIPTSLSIDEINTDSYVVKERKGAGSISIGINLNKKEALEQAKHLKDPLYQPFVEGIEWSIDLYRTLEGHVKGIVSRQRNVVVEGESQVTTTASYPPLEHLCHQIADLLDLYGHVMFQIIEDKDGGFHVIECNPRFGGASTASIAVGLNSFVWFLMESKGISLEEYPFIRSKHEIQQIRYVTDKFNVVKEF